MFWGKRAEGVKTLETNNGEYYSPIMTPHETEK